MRCISYVAIRHRETNMTLTAGYDVGGAHLKVALVCDGVVLHASQIPCPLWRGLDQLDIALAQANAITCGAPRHAVTMTGELSDIFPDRYTGVVMLVERLAVALGPECRFWMGRRGMGDAAEAAAHYEDVASANFLATAVVAARIAGDGLLIDMGSTTTDIIELAGGIPVAKGFTDGERLRTGELVYTGLTRTPVMGVTTRGTFQGVAQGLARDPFATMADVRRVLGELPDGVDQHGTSDGRSKSVTDSRARLARCFGRDAGPGEDRDWAEAARSIAEIQLVSIMEGCQQVGAVTTGKQVVAAGIGAGVVAQVAVRIGMATITFGELAGAPQVWSEWATRCAPAVSVAMLTK
jgi:(4-(4-[2-(gamma-L-glutamylamino)ethyl]phenoxymethyl)furan-2-yl)methanamine synthase